MCHTLRDVQIVLVLPASEIPYTAVASKIKKWYISIIVQSLLLKVLIYINAIINRGDFNASIYLWYIPVLSKYVHGSLDIVM